jgi:hypothetical protein
MNERRILEALYKGHYMTEMKRFDPSVFNQFKDEYGYYLDELSEEERVIIFSQKIPQFHLMHLFQKDLNSKSELFSHSH